MFIISKYTIVDCLSPQEYVTPMNNTISYYFQEIYSDKIKSILHHQSRLPDLSENKKFYLKFPIKNLDKDGNKIECKFTHLLYYTDLWDDIYDDLSSMYPYRFYDDLSDGDFDTYISEYNINIHSNRIIKVT